MLELRIEYGGKRQAAVERLQFEIIKNGTYLEIDAV
jgi:hypothetical protein